MKKNMKKLITGPIEYYVAIKLKFGIKNIIIFGFLISIITNMLIRNDFFLDTRFLRNIDTNIIIIMGSFIGLSTIFFVIKNTFKNKAVNYVDYYVTIIWFSMLINYVAVRINDNIYTKLETIISLAMHAIPFLFMLYRSYRTYDSKEISVTNLISLSQLIDENVEKIEKPILLFEEVTGHDLLSRHGLVTRIHYILNNVQPNKQFVLGLEGEWGSGKSSLIRMVTMKDFNEGTIIINDFDPWKYNDEESMLVGMIEKILENVEIGLPNIKTRLLINKIVSSVFSSYGKHSINVANIFSNKSDTNDLTKLVDAYLDRNDKRLIFIIDNIDRTQKEHIYFIYKTVASLLNINRVTYVLSYEPETVKSAFNKLNIDYKYLEKIINLRFEIPKDNTKMLLLAVNSIKAIHNIYNPDDKTVTNNKFLELAVPIKMPRDLVLIINRLSTAMNVDFVNKLNSLHLIGITIIRTLAPDLFASIRDNGHHFIEKNIISYNMPRLIHTSPDKKREEASAFFDDLFNDDKWSTYMPILTELFPSVKDYQINPKTMLTTQFNYDRESKPSYDIHDGNYFNVYLAESENVYVEIDEMLDTFIAKFNQAKNKKDHVLPEISNLDGERQILFIEGLKRRLNEVNELKKIDLVNYILRVYYSLDMSMIHINPQNRCIVLLVSLISKLNDTRFTEVITDISSEYKNLNIIKKLMYWFDTEHGDIIYADKDKYDLLNKVYIKVVQKIYDKKVDIYQDDNYFRFNARSIEKVLGEDAAKEFFKVIISPSNIGKFLYDFTEVSYSMKHIYNVLVKDVFKFISQEEVDKHIEQAKNTFDNLFIFEAYKNALNRSENDYKERFSVNEYKALYISPQKS